MRRAKGPRKDRLVATASPAASPAGPAAGGSCSTTRLLVLLVAVLSGALVLQNTVGMSLQLRGDPRQQRRQVAAAEAPDGGIAAGVVVRHSTQIAKLRQDLDRLRREFDASASSADGATTSIQQAKKAGRTTETATTTPQHTTPQPSGALVSREPASSHATYFTLSYAPCAVDPSQPASVRAGICRAPTAPPAEHCAVRKTPGADTYNVDLAKDHSGKSFWTTLQDEHGERTVAINTHDPVKEDIYISKSVWATGVWDHYIRDVFAHVLGQIPPAERAAALVVDVGANIAYFSLTAAAFGFRTISFEPMRFNLERILSSIERNPGFAERMTVYNMAVSNAHGQLSFKATSNTNAGNFAAQAGGGTGGTYGVDYVNSASLDEIIDDDVLLMKIDVETFEPFVLDGARNLLCNHIVRHIVLEFDKQQSSAHGGACQPDVMLSWMDRLGYELRDVIVGSPVIPVAGLDISGLPPNVWFSLKDVSAPPSQRLGVDVCKT